MEVERVGSDHGVLLRKCQTGREFVMGNETVHQKTDLGDGNVFPCLRLSDGHVVNLSGDMRVRLVVAKLRWAYTDEELERNDECG